jgi:hypothetical protein
MLTSPLTARWRPGHFAQVPARRRPQTLVRPALTSDMTPGHARGSRTPRSPLIQPAHQRQGTRTLAEVPSAVAALSSIPRSPPRWHPNARPIRTHRSDTLLQPAPTSNMTPGRARGSYTPQPHTDPARSPAKRRPDARVGAHRGRGRSSARSPPKWHPGTPDARPVPCTLQPHSDPAPPTAEIAPPATHRGNPARPGHMTQPQHGSPVLGLRSERSVPFDEVSHDIRAGVRVA